MVVPTATVMLPLLEQALYNFRMRDHPGVGRNFVYNVASDSAKATLARCIADEIAMTLT